MTILDIISYELIDVGLPIEVTRSPAGRVWQGFMQYVTRQEGVLEVYWGRETRNSAVAMVFIGWMSFTMIIFIIFADFWKSLEGSEV